MLLVLMFCNFYVIHLHIFNVSPVYLQLSHVQKTMMMALCRWNMSDMN